LSPRLPVLLRTDIPAGGKMESTEEEWRRIAHLADLKIQDVADKFFPEIEKKTAFLLESPGAAKVEYDALFPVLEVWLYRLEQWITIVNDTYLEVLSKLKIRPSSEILTKVFAKAINPSIDEYKKKCIAALSNLAGTNIGKGTLIDHLESHAEILRKRLRRKLKIHELELQGLRLPKPMLELDADTMRIRIRTRWYSLTEAQFRMVKVLMEANGNWVGGKEIGGRPDKLLNRMPKPVAKLIRTHKSNGYSILPSIASK
jgi:hypothetical protein